MRSAPAKNKKRRKQPQAVYFYDTETNNYDKEGKPYGRFVIGCLVGKSGEPKITRTPTEFMEIISRECRQKRIRAVKCYVHNLAFDLAGFWFELEAIDPTINKAKVITSGLGQVCTVGIFWHGVKIVFVDSYLITLLPLAKFEKAFGLKIGKSVGKWNYNLYRGDDWEPTPDEIEYLTHDVLVLREWWKKTKPQKITAGSEAFNSWLDLVGRDFTHNVEGWGNLKLDAKLRSSYLGGWTYVNPNHQGEILNGGCHIDMISAHIKSEYDGDLPYKGFCSGQEALNDSHAPDFIEVDKCILELRPYKWHTVKSLEHAAEYPDKVECKERWFCWTDWQWVKKNYFVKVKDKYARRERVVDPDSVIVDAMLWRERCNAINPYIEKFYRLKQEATDAGERSVAKLRLNSLYGKFGQRNDDRIWSLAGGKCRPVATDKDPEYVDCKMVAWASIICARTRDRIWSAVEKVGFDNFYYADTDSIFCSLDAEDCRRRLGDTVARSKSLANLGKWDFEHISFKQAKFLRAKCYKVVDAVCPDGTVEQVCKIAGYNGEVLKNVPIERFAMGLKASEELQKCGIIKMMKSDSTKPAGDKRGRKATEWGFAILDDLDYELGKGGIWQVL
jgi:hypothetical protein